MDGKHKEILMHSVTHDNIWTVQNTFDEHTLIQDESYFDNELLKAALKRRHTEIVNFLLKLGCRVTNSKEVNPEETALHLAVQLDNSSIITKILSNGASIYEKNKNGETPIVAGFKQGFYNAVFTILNYMHLNSFHTVKSLKQLRSADKVEVHHFHIACLLNNLKVVEHYLNKVGIDVNTPFSQELTKFAGLNPVHYAIKTYNLSLIEKILKVNCDLTIKNNNGQSPLHAMYYADLGGSPMLKKTFIFGNETKFANSIDSNGVSNFHLCCTVNYPDLIKKFIDEGVDVNSAVSLSCPLYPGFVPLHFAVKHSCTEVVALLLKNGADCNKVDKKGNTPLHMACEKTNAVGIKIVEMLLDFGAYPAALDAKGFTPLHMIFYKTDSMRESVIDKFVSGIPRKDNFIDNQGLSHFHIVCTRDDASRVEDFLDSGAAIDGCVAAGLYSGYTPLYFAVLFNRKHVVKVLLQRNAQANIKTSLKFTPLHIACKFFTKYRAMESKCDADLSIEDWTSIFRNKLDIVKLLLRHGADVHAKDCSGDIPLIQACSIDAHCSNAKLLKLRNAKRKELVEILLGNDANINVRTKRQGTILHVITRSKVDKYLAEFLIGKGADANAVDVDKFSPLHLAVQLVNPVLVKVFLKHRSNVNGRTKNSATPLEMAIHNVKINSSSAPAKDTLCALLEHGANANVRNENGQTLLQHAVERRMLFVVKQLLQNGADINMEDLSGGLCISSLNAWHKESNDIAVYKKTEYVEVFKIIFEHVQKLIALGIVVDRRITDCCTRLLVRYEIVATIFRTFINLNLPLDFDRMVHVLDDCNAELERMKLVKINSSTSLYDVLKADTELSKYVRNSSFVKILESVQDFPMYSFLIKFRYREATIRRNEVECARTSLKCISGFHFPDLCCDAVLKYLTNEELINLNVCAGTSTKKKSKRKLSDEATDGKRKRILYKQS